MNSTTTTPVMQMSNEDFIKLYKKGLIPLYVVLPMLVWVLHDYFVTLEDEVNHVWKKKITLGRSLFFVIRYYTVLLLIFDVAQIHSFSIPGVTSKAVCLAMDPTIRIVGAVSLWTIEIIMQLRIYALYDRSKKILITNAILFILSIIAFLAILIINVIGRPALIAKAIGLPLPGCPVINGGFQWAQWIPATLFEFVMFLQVLYKAVSSRMVPMPRKGSEDDDTGKAGNTTGRISLEMLLVREHVLYFLGITVLLVFNNMMVITGITGVPWFGLAPFHASMGIMTNRMLLHLFKFTHTHLEGGLRTDGALRSEVWRGIERAGKIGEEEGNHPNNSDTFEASDALDNFDWRGVGDVGGMHDWRRDPEEMREVRDGEGVLFGSLTGDVKGKGKGKGKGKMRSDVIFDDGGDNRADWGGSRGGLDNHDDSSLAHEEGSESRRTSSTLTLTTTISNVSSSSSSSGQARTWMGHLQPNASRHDAGELDVIVPRRDSDGTVVDVQMDGARSSWKRKGKEKSIEEV